MQQTKQIGLESVLHRNENNSTAQKKYIRYEESIVNGFTTNFESKPEQKGFIFPIKKEYKVVGQSANREAPTMVIPARHSRSKNKSGDMQVIVQRPQESNSKQLRLHYVSSQNNSMKKSDIQMKSTKHHTSNHHPQPFLSPQNHVLQSPRAHKVRSPQHPIFKNKN